MALALKKIFRPIPVHSLALKLALAYAFVGCLWILFSDKLVAKFETDYHHAISIQTFKGWAFILVTSILLYGLVASYLRKIAKAQKELIQSEETFSTAFRYSPESVTLSGVDDGVYLDVNEGFTELTGHTRSEVIGTSTFDLNIWANPEDRRKIVEQLKTHAQVLGFETPIRNKDGGIRPCIMSASMIYLRGQQCLMAITKDITDRKRIEEATARFNRELAEKNKELESIIYVASHDLRSALVNIQGFSKELLMAADKIRAVAAAPEMPSRLKNELKEPLETDLPESIEFITTSTAKIDTLLTGLLRLSHIGHESLNMTEVNAHELVDRAIKELEFELSQAGASITVGTLPSAIGDKSQLYHVFHNLIANAIHYLDTSKPGLIKITGMVRNAEVVYCIEDNGIGIAAEYHDKIFEIFHRLNPNETTGEGLGLTVVRRILERQNGRVWVESTPGQGSRFYVSLPAVKPS